nr:sulfated surface glycoprotein 185-like [Lolium perenne]
MSSGSAAFKVAAVAALLALLVLPSMGRCPSLSNSAPPPPPMPVIPSPSPLAPVTTPPASAPVPAPAPGPAPPLSCRDCWAPLIPACSSKCDAGCEGSCKPKQPDCDNCNAKVSNCKSCCDDGTCSCDCKINLDMDCRTDCYVSTIGCQFCEQGIGKCMADCLSPCNANCAN